MSKINLVSQSGGELEFGECNGFPYVEVGFGGQSNNTFDLTPEQVRQLRDSLNQWLRNNGDFGA